jgi:hypothetical protein
MRYFRPVVAFALAAFLVLSLGTGAIAGAITPLEKPEQKALVSSNALQIKRVDEKWAMQDGIKLPVTVFFPVAEDSSQAFPMIVFVHPLGVDVLNYENQAREYATEGYVAVIYGVRGTFGAEGQFNMIDPAVDLPDMSRIITLASKGNRFPVLRDDRGPVVGVTGYSQGGVMSYLIASRKDPRQGDPAARVGDQFDPAPSQTGHGFQPRAAGGAEHILNLEPDLSGPACSYRLKR